MKPTWWITIKSIPEGEIVLEEDHVDKHRLIGIIYRYTEEPANVIFEIGLD